MDDKLPYLKENERAIRLFIEARDLKSQDEVKRELSSVDDAAFYLRSILGFRCAKCGGYISEKEIETQDCRPGSLCNKCLGLTVASLFALGQALCLLII